MDWQDLKTFLEFSNNLNLSKTAVSLGVDHSTVARRIKNLEQSLGVQLLERTNKSARLTSSGIIIAESGKAMFDTELKIKRDIARLDPDMQGKVRISAPPSFSKIIIPSIITEIVQSFPALQIDINASLTHADLNAMEADIAIRLSKPHEPNFIPVKVGDFGFKLYGTFDYLKHTATDNMRYIAYPDDYNHYPQQKWILEKFEKEKIVIQSEDIFVQAEAAKLGLGLALLPDYVANEYPDLMSVPMKYHYPKREIYIIIHEDMRSTPKYRAVFDLLKARLKETKF